MSERSLLLSVFLVLSLLAACAGGSGQPTQSPGQSTGFPAATEIDASPSPPAAAGVDEPAQTRPAQEQPTATSQVADPSDPALAATAEPGVTFRNPVLRADFPDPFVLEEDGMFYAYATNSSGRNIQLAVSEDMVNWQLRTDAMPAFPSWAFLGGSFVWAPEVIKIGEQYNLYYTARYKEEPRQCIGVAVAGSPEGKFRDPNDQPLVCQLDQGGSIDASPFLDGDTLYLLWKNDGNCCGMATWLYIQEMAPDGLSLVGEPVQLIRNDEVWEGSLIEAPTMWKHDDRYYLFFSANSYGGVEYAVGYAVCETPTGPCEKAEENPILASLLENPPVIGPGHQTIIHIDDQDWIVYHAWEVLSDGRRGDRRLMWIDRLDWDDGRPVVRGPTRGVQPVPLQGSP